MQDRAKRNQTNRGVNCIMADVSAKKPGRKPIVKWQRPNMGVLYALIPASIGSIYFFGWRSLLIIAVVSLAGFITEFAFLRFYYKEPVTSAVFVTSLLFSLSMPPTIPIWIAVIGIVFGVAIGKMAFGGFGRNVFNPALTGRSFIYISFGSFMTARWVSTLGTGFPGGFASFAADSITRATPIRILAEGKMVPIMKLVLGNISGCLGETSTILLLIGGVFILYRKFANYRIVVSGILSMLFLQTALWISGLSGAVDPFSGLLSGGFMLGILFMATDPVSASQTNTGRWIYGSIIGILTTLIRTFSIWPEGIMFAILFGNMFAPIIDYTVKNAKSRK